MSMINMGGWRMVPNPDVARVHPKWFLSMGLTSEMVSNEYNISRKEQDEFSVKSVNKALAAIEAGKFKDQIVPITIKETI